MRINASTTAVAEDRQAHHRRIEACPAAATGTGASTWMGVRPPAPPGRGDPPR
ncbi:MAG: hypothetical protein R3F43_15690 [bacterium]